jgi:hypothetical protein
VIRQAAAETREHAIEIVPDEADQAVVDCSQDGHVVFATSDAIHAFHAVAAPTIATLREDPLTARLIDAITELNAVTLPSAGVQPCDPPAGTALYPVADPEGYSATVPPPGAYLADLTYDVMVANGVADR